MKLSVSTEAVGEGVTPHLRVRKAIPRLTKPRGRKMLDTNRLPRGLRCSHPDKNKPSEPSFWIQRGAEGGRHLVS